MPAMERSLEDGDEKDVECLADMQRSLQLAAEVDVCFHSSDDEDEAPVALSSCGLLLLSTALILVFLLVWMVYIFPPVRGDVFSQSGEEHQRIHFLNKALPTSDKECFWDYRRAQCGFPEVCQYDYRFGDMSLSRSCRLKSSNPFSGVQPLPSSDEECVWDYRRLQCKFPEVCHYHYHFGDMDLGSSCRLKFSNASSQVVAKCLGSSDYAIVNNPGFAAQLDQVGRASFSVWQRKVKTEESLKRHMKLGLSEGCASCYVDVAVCTTSHCLRSIVTGGHNSPRAWECYKDHKCLEELATCTGLPS